MTDVFRRRSITTRLVAGMCLSMAILLALTGAFIYERMSFALSRSIRDVPKANAVEIDARRRHRDEALHELLAQLALAYAGTLAVSGFIGYRIARTAIQPVEDMRRQAAAATDTTTVRLVVGDSGDELSRLASTLNELLGRVEAGVAREHQLIADASHELRTPLGGMLMQVDLALVRERTPQETRTALQRIRGETQRLIRLSNDLLLIARLQESGTRKPEPVDVDDLIRHALADHIAAHPGHPAPAYETDGTRATVMADRLGLQQVIHNLLANAQRHGQPPITITNQAASGHAEIHVTDHGPGFPSGFIHQAFERFTTASVGASTATGLGLAIVAETARAAGGTTGALNLPKGGADVWIRLPTVAHDTKETQEPTGR